MKKITINKSRKIIWIIIAVLILLVIAFGIYKLAPNYITKEVKDKTNLILNNNNVTEKLKKDVYIDEKNVIYLSIEDLANYFDKYIKIDEDRNLLITTSNTKVGKMKIGENVININGTNKKISSSVIQIDGTTYIPFSEMCDVYNIELEYLEDENVVTVDSLDRKLVKANLSKNVSVKYKQTGFSKTLEKIKKGEDVVLVSIGEGWAKIRTQNGTIGYIKEKALGNQTVVREKMDDTGRLDQKVNLVWDYYSEYVKAPDRSGTKIEGVNVVSPAFFSLKQSGNGEIFDNAAQQGIAYIEWAKSNGYKVWAMFSNNSYRTTTSEILNDATKTEQMIENILALAVQYNVDGINLDFENMNEEDKEVYSRFVIELGPRLKDYGMTLSIDVTAPDGAPTWSLCFDRNLLASVADYLIFMAYDQHGPNDNKIGTVAGYDWVEKNIIKFIDENREAVDNEKLILGIPFYTRTWWKDASGKVQSATVNIKTVESILPEGTQKTWDEATKQFYVEYDKNGNHYQMWIEDETSIREKIKLANQYELGGIAFWEKDREDEEIWTMIKEELYK